VFDFGIAECLAAALEVVVLICTRLLLDSKLLLALGTGRAISIWLLLVLVEVLLYRVLGRSVTPPARIANGFGIGGAFALLSGRRLSLLDV
jgi:hypothetical protein